MNDLIAINNRLPSDRHPLNVYLASLADGSQRTMISAAENIAQLFGVGAADFGWTAIRYQHVQAIRSKLIDLYAPATANRHMALLRGVLKENWRLGYMSAEEYRRSVDVKPIKGERVLAGRFIEREELELLIDRCRARNKIVDTRDAAIIGMLYVCGVRRDELISLSLSDYSDSRIKVLGKGNKERFVPVNKQLQGLIADWFKWRGTEGEPLFTPVNRISRLTTQAIYTMLQRRGHAVGIPALSPHDFRRTFISNLFDKGVDMPTIATLAGHEDIETTRRYDRRNEKAQRAAVELLSIPGYD